jgi:hypothetical protein
MYNRDRRVTGPGILIGVWITLLGVIFLLDQLGIVSSHVSFHFVWPGILIALGLWGVFSTNPGQRFWGVIALTWGAFSLSNALGYMHVAFVSLWPLILIGLGVAMLLNSSGRLGPMSWHNPPGPNADPGQDPAQMPPPEPAQGAAPDQASAPSQPQNPTRDATAPDATRASFSGGAPSFAPAGMPPGPPPPPAASFFGVNPGPGNTDDATFDQSVILSGFKRRVTSQRFRYGKVTAILGGFHLDLTRADLDNNRAVVHIDTVFGGGEIRVPDTWRITIEATAVAGAFVDETYPQPSGMPGPVKQLIIRGAAIFGGVNIKN